MFEDQVEQGSGTAGSRAIYGSFDGWIWLAGNIFTAFFLEKDFIIIFLKTFFRKEKFLTNFLGHGSHGITFKNVWWLWLSQPKRFPTPEVECDWIIYLYLKTNYQSDSICCLGCLIMFTWKPVMLDCFGFICIHTLPTNTKKNFYPKHSYGFFKLKNDFNIFWKYSFNNETTIEFVINCSIRKFELFFHDSQ